MTPPNSSAPASADLRPRGRARAPAGISPGYFMVLLDMTVLSVAEPDRSLLSRATAEDRPA